MSKLESLGFIRSDRWTDNFHPRLPNSAQSFNQPIGTWSTGNVENMYSMFRGAIRFNQDLFFDTSNVVDMSNMFFGATSMTGDLSLFDTSEVFSMESMFRDSVYNGDISMWDVSSLAVATKMYVLKSVLGSCSNSNASLKLTQSIATGLKTTPPSIPASRTGIRSRWSFSKECFSMLPVLTRSCAGS